MQLHDLLLSIIAFVSEIMGTVSGFGSSTFFVPMALFLESFHFVLALTAILHCFGNASKIVLFRTHFDRKVFLQLVFPSVLATGLGAWLTTQFNSAFMERALGLFLIAFALFFLVARRRVLRLPTWAAILLSAASGLSTGFIGTGGAIRGIVLTALNVPMHSFVVVSAAIDFGGDFLRAAIYLRNGFMDWSQWFYIPILAIAAFAGARTGRLILSYIKQHQFEKIVAVFILISGLAMLF